MALPLTAGTLRRFLDKVPDDSPVFIVDGSKTCKIFAVQIEAFDVDDFQTKTVVLRKEVSNK